MRIWLVSLLVCAGLASACQTGAKRREFEVSRAGAMDAIKLLQAQPENSWGRLELYVSVEPAPAPKLLWRAMNGQSVYWFDPSHGRAKPACKLSEAACREASTITEAVLIEYSEWPRISAMTRYATLAEGMEAHARVFPSSQGRAILFVAFPPTPDNLPERDDGRFVWKRTPIYAAEGAANERMICPWRYTDSCHAYEDMRSIEVITLVKKPDGTEERQREAMPTTFEGAKRTFDLLGRQDGIPRYAFVEAAEVWRGSNFTVNFTGVTQLESDRICGGQEKSLVDEQCIRFAGIERIMVHDMTRTAGDVIGDVAIFPFRFLAAIGP